MPVEQEDTLLCHTLGYKASPPLNPRVWGAERRIDIVFTGKDNRRLGIECKFQATSGSAEEKIPATIQDIKAWPIPGIVVFDGDGFSDNMRAYLTSTGMAVELDDLESWLGLFFGLPLTGGS